MPVFRFSVRKARQRCGDCQRYCPARSVCWDTEETKFAHSEACGAYIATVKGLLGSRSLAQLSEKERQAIIACRDGGRQ